MKTKMNKFKLFLATLITLIGLSQISTAQQNYNFNVGGLQFSSGSSVPGSCAKDGSFFYLNTGTKAWYTCVSGTWVSFTGVGSGVTASGSLTNGQALFGKGGSVIGSSAALIYADAFSGVDPCAAINAALTATTNGQKVTAEGFSNTAALASYGGTTWPDAKCSVNPIPQTAQGKLILPALIFHLQTTWVVPNRFTMEGQGWDRNPVQGFGATVLSACPVADSALCGGIAFPGTAGGFLQCWGNSRSGQCDRGGDNPLFDSNVEKLTFDCKGVAKCGAIDDMNAEEGSAGRHLKIMNAYNDGRGLVIAGGKTPAAGSITSISGTTVNGSGLTFDLQFNQVNFSSDVACSGNPCNYTIASINAAGTVATLDTAYTGAACTNCSMTISNAAAQNGEFLDLYIVHINTTACTANGIAILMNTGSGSNEGPKFIREVTAVNGCATQMADLIRISGCCTALENIHLESFVNGITLGADAPANGIFAYNLWVGGITAGSSSAVLISNFSASTHNIGLMQLKTIGPNKPTNIINDVQCTHAIAASSESDMAEYVMGASCAELVTSSHTIASGFFGIILETGLSYTGTSAAAGTEIFAPTTTSFGISISGTETMRFISTGLKVAGSNAIQFANGVIANTVDLAVGRQSPNTFSIGTSTVNGLGYLQSSGVRVTTPPSAITSTTLVVIPGLTWTIPAVAQAYKFDCDIEYTQSVAVVADAFGIQAATNAPSLLSAVGDVQITLGPPSTYVSGSTTPFATTTATNVVAFTPGVISTAYTAHIHGTLAATASGHTLNIMALTGNASDALNIQAGSGCHIEVTSN